MRIVAVIPVKGRLPLLEHTIRRLYEKNGVYQVICVGETVEEEALCIALGAEFVKHVNFPLGKKWNAGFMAAKKHKPDGCLFVGSSDWVSNDWLPYLEPFLHHSDLIGKPDFNLLDVAESGLRLCHWSGYGKGVREKEPIGIGRVLSKRILDKMNWQPMDEDRDNSLDWSMYKKVLAHGGKVVLVKDSIIKSLSISTDRWENKHKFEQHFTNQLPSEKIPDYIDWLNLWFPEGLKLFK